MTRLAILLTNRGFLFGIALYVGGFLVLSRGAEFSPSDTLLELLVFGIGFSLLAWWTTIRAKQLVISQHPSAREMAGLTLYVILLSLYLAFGTEWIDSWLPSHWIASTQIRFFVVLAKKLLVFVLVPFALFGPLSGYKSRD